MNHQSEAQLEKTLIEQLERLGFSSFVLEDADALAANLRGQLEKFNETTFSDGEFTKILGNGTGTINREHGYRLVMPSIV